MLFLALELNRPEFLEGGITITSDTPPRGAGPVGDVTPPTSDDVTFATLGARTPLCVRLGPKAPPPREAPAPPTMEDDTAPFLDSPPKTLTPPLPRCDEAGGAVGTPFVAPPREDKIPEGVAEGFSERNRSRRAAEEATIGRIAVEETERGLADDVIGRFEVRARGRDEADDGIGRPSRCR